eukprot:6209139-Prymnesium_polylepis.2
MSLYAARNPVWVAQKASGRMGAAVCNRTSVAMDLRAVRVICTHTFITQAFEHRFREFSRMIHLNRLRDEQYDPRAGIASR